MGGRGRSGARPRPLRTGRAAGADPGRHAGDPPRLPADPGHGLGRAGRPGAAGVAIGLFRRHGSGTAAPAKVADRLAPGQAVAFRYPGEDDRALAIRLPDGRLVGCSAVCTHLACAVLWRQEDGHLECPCHDGVFDPATGEVVAGPPPRPLPSGAACARTPAASGPWGPTDGRPRPGRPPASRRASAPRGAPDPGRRARAPRRAHRPRLGPRRRPRPPVPGPPARPLPARRRAARQRARPAATRDCGAAAAATRASTPPVPAGPAADPNPDRAVDAERPHRHRRHHRRRPAVGTDGRPQRLARPPDRPGPAAARPSRSCRSPSPWPSGWPGRATADPQGARP